MEPESAEDSRTSLTEATVVPPSMPKKKYPPYFPWQEGIPNVALIKSPTYCLGWFIRTGRHIDDPGMLPQVEKAITLPNWTKHGFPERWQLLEQGLMMPEIWVGKRHAFIMIARNIRKSIVQLHDKTFLEENVINRALAALDLTKEMFDGVGGYYPKLVWVRFVGQIPNLNFPCIGKYGFSGKQQPQEASASPAEASELELLNDIPPEIEKLFSVPA